MLEELQEQYTEGGDGPSLPVGTTFVPNNKASHRADMGKEVDARPVGRRRGVVGKKLSKLIEKAEQLDCAIQRTEIHSPTSATCFVFCTTDNMYYIIHFENNPTCTCSPALSIANISMYT